MKLEVLNERVLIEPIEMDNTTSGGIILPQSSSRPIQFGKVINVGSGIISNGTRIPIGVSEGDKVMFSSKAGQEVQINGEKLKIMTERDILAILRD